jgi:thioredoxin reductase (NADPH)
MVLRVIEPSADHERDVYIVGRRHSPHVQELRDFLTRNRVAFGWVDLDHDPLVRALGARVPDGLRMPVFVYPDGSLTEWPADDEDEMNLTLARAQLAERVGLHTRPDKDLYDVVIVGAGPAGLTAAVYAASEGLDTVVVEHHAPGGQAGTSSRIENYPGFPDGISGSDLAAAAFDQAVRFGAEFVIGCDFASAAADDEGYAHVTLVNGAVVRGRAGIGATGSHYRRLDAPGVKELLGAGVYYGSAPREAAYHRDGQVFVVGGANSAGQAALYLAEFAAHVTLVVRAKSLADGMSQYLVSRVEAHPRISVRTNARVVRAMGNERLEALDLDDAGTIDSLDADALFILIGGEPTSERVDWVRRDGAGFVLTGPDVLADGGRGTWWKLERDPMFLESSTPGIFFAGDVRHGSIKRVASAVGEGAMAVQQVHRYLAEQKDRRSSAEGAT